MRKSIFIRGDLLRGIETRQPKSLTKYVNHMATRYEAFVTDNYPRLNEAEEDVLREALAGFDQHLMYISNWLVTWLDEHAHQVEATVPDNGDHLWNILRNGTHSQHLAILARLGPTMGDIV